jgi:hypothetical protein
MKSVATAKYWYPVSTEPMKNKNDTREQLCKKACNTASIQMSIPARPYTSHEKICMMAVPTTHHLCHQSSIIQGPHDCHARMVRCRNKPGG